MSARDARRWKMEQDEQQASDYLDKLRLSAPRVRVSVPWDKPRVRPRVTALALAILVALVLAVLLAISRADIRYISVEAQFNPTNANASGFSYFGLGNTSRDIHFLVEYDTDTPDSEPNSNLGIYKCESCKIYVGFGDYYLETPTTEIRIYAGFNGLTQAIGFGIEDATTAWGLSFGEYEMYALFANFYFPVSGWNDHLSQLTAQENNPAFSAYSSYLFLHGYNGETEVNLRTNQPISYFTWK